MEEIGVSESLMNLGEATGVVIGKRCWLSREWELEWKQQAFSWKKKKKKKNKELGGRIERKRVRERLLEWKGQLNQRAGEPFNSVPPPAAAPVALDRGIIQDSRLLFLFSITTPTTFVIELPLKGNRSIHYRRKWLSHCRKKKKKTKTMLFASIE